MGVSLIYGVFAVGLLAVLVFGSFTRTLGFTFLQEKMYGLVTGVVLGYILSYFQISLLLDPYFSVVLFCFLLEKAHNLPKVLPT